MTINTNDFKNGVCIYWNNEIYSILEFQHVKPGKGGAFVRAKLRNLQNGKIIDHTFNAGIKIPVAKIKTETYQFLYQDGEQYHFMHQSSFDQIELNKNQINFPEFLKEGQGVQISIDTQTDNILSCELPDFVHLKVIDTLSNLKGSTITKNKPLKDGILENNIDIQIPLFIENGDIIKVDTRTKSYVERIRKKT